MQTKHLNKLYYSSIVIVILLSVMTEKQYKYDAGEKGELRVLKMVSFEAISCLQCCSIFLHQMNNSRAILVDLVVCYTAHFGCGCCHREQKQRLACCRVHLTSSNMAGVKSVCGLCGRGGGDWRALHPQALTRAAHEWVSSSQSINGGDGCDTVARSRSCV